MSLSANIHSEAVRVRTIERTRRMGVAQVSEMAWALTLEARRTREAGCATGGRASELARPRRRISARPAGGARPSLARV